MSLFELQYHSLAEWVSLYRYHASEARRLAHRMIAEPVYNRSTLTALERRRYHRDQIAIMLHQQEDPQLRELSGLLVEEANLRDRIKRHPDRHDLTVRLRGVTLHINRLARPSKRNTVQEIRNTECLSLTPLS